MTEFQMIGLVMLVVAVLMLLLSGYLFLRKRRFLAASVITTGKVTGFREVDATVVVSGNDDLQWREQENVHKSTSRAPEITYHDARGVAYKILGPAGSAVKSMLKGDSVQVRYSRDNPQEAVLTDFFSTWLEVVATAIIGSVFLLIGGMFQLIA